MRVAVYGKHFSENFNPAINYLFEHLQSAGIELYIYNPFCKLLFDRINMPKKYFKFWEAEDLVKNKIDLLLSIGGDGTILETSKLVRDSGVPVLGINTGRLGFLSSIAREQISYAVRAIAKNDLSIEERSVIALEQPGKLFPEWNFAINEFSVIKKDSSSMITVDTFIDGEYLNSYWADGLIVSTPTGSTAYNLSCGGPIISPQSKSFVITPISPHNLNIRPIVLPDNSEIRLKINGRDESYLLALDARNKVYSSEEDLILRKANFSFKLAKLKSDNFYSTLRNKLLWGLDQRN